MLSSSRYNNSLFLDLQEDDLSNQWKKKVQLIILQTL